MVQITVHEWSNVPVAARSSRMGYGDHTRNYACRAVPQTLALAASVGKHGGVHDSPMVMPKREAEGATGRDTRLP